MALKRTADTLTVLIGLFIIYIGVSFLVAPTSTATGFGLPAWPSGDAAAFLNVKGVRDIVSGLAPLTLLFLGQRRALGWVLLAEALVPIGDGTVVLSWGGSPATAFGVHYFTAAIVIVAGLLQIRASREAREGRPAVREAVASAR